VADEKPTTLFLPDGRGHRFTPDERVELRPGVMEWLRQFADVAQALTLGIHCGRCGADLVGHNGEHDHTFSVACGCREFVSQNRDGRPRADVPLH